MPCILITKAKPISASECGCERTQSWSELLSSLDLEPHDRAILSVLNSTFFFAEPTRASILSLDTKIKLTTTANMVKSTQISRLDGMFATVEAW